ncbi:hypothetical protein NDU88_005433 [Pleurodeles waltl]|uniref:Uncharacterized protein n=1 Tax=Pleurodeles waltl TaxID=8319 RepID=A0AAV7NME8_PLEWA|nr:hypothetical protein NDU88_005433 [Pleurodeles waltl]
MANNMEGSTGSPTSSACTVGADSGILQSIYNSIKELQTETRIENRHARVATKRLQGTVRKVAKSCTEIETKLCSMEERIAAAEVDVDALREQCVTQDGQLTDLMWKLEDYETRQRRNNLRFLGINEGLEGSDIRAYVIKLLRGAFPELTNWDWETEVQSVHRFPAVRREGGHSAEPKYPRAILVFFGNYLLRQTIFDKARPNAPRSVEGVSVFTLPDSAKMAVPTVD